MDWARILAYVTGTVDQELLAWNEYLAAENRILKVQLNGRLKLSDAERAVLGEIGHRLGRQVLADHANDQLLGLSLDAHQGKGNVLLFPRATDRQREGRFRAGRATTSRATRAI